MSEEQVISISEFVKGKNEKLINDYLKNFENTLAHRLMLSGEISRIENMMINLNNAWEYLPKDSLRPLNNAIYLLSRLAHLLLGRTGIDFIRAPVKYRLCMIDGNVALAVDFYEYGSDIKVCSLTIEYKKYQRQLMIDRCNREVAIRSKGDTNFNLPPSDLLSTIANDIISLSVNNRSDYTFENKNSTLLFQTSLVRLQAIYDIKFSISNEHYSCNLR